MIRPTLVASSLVASSLVAVSLVAGVTLGLSACSDELQSTGPDSAETEPIRRDQLGQAAPQNAPGQQLYLQRVTIAPGAQLAPHFHEGTQVAYVESGTLTYDIISGTVEVTGPDGSSTSATGPEVIEITAGSWLVETDTVTHYGANSSAEPVVILLTALLADGAPFATPTGS